MLILTRKYPLHWEFSHLDGQVDKDYECHLVSLFVYSNSWLLGTENEHGGMDEGTA